MNTEVRNNMRKESGAHSDSSALYQSETIEKAVIVLISDMVQFSRRTSEMRPEAIRDFVSHYHKNLRSIIAADQDESIDFEPSAGDTSTTLFESRQGETGHEKSVRALQAAVRIAKAVSRRNLPETRVGIFAGNIIEARIGRQTLKFGNSFAAASRLEELCDYFGTHILMDRDVAQCQTEAAKYIVSIGKITPKNFLHPIHVYSIYLPGIHRWPHGNNEKLLEYVKTKNLAMDFFCGNELKAIQPNFAIARDTLRKAMTMFSGVVGREDKASLRIMGYISENPYPTEDFARNGMIIDAHKGDYRFGVRMLHLAQQLFKAIDYEMYQTLVIETEWERSFRLEWHEKGKTVIRAGEKPDGVYYIDRGEVGAFNSAGDLIFTMRKGDVFGEMTFFTAEEIRTASLVAVTDLVVRKILSSDFKKFPGLQNIVKEIIRKRLLTIDRAS